MCARIAGIVVLLILLDAHLVDPKVFQFFTLTCQQERVSVDCMAD